MINKAKKNQIEIEYLKWEGNQREMFDFLTNNTKVNCSPTLEENTFRIDFCNGGCQLGNLIIKTKEGEMKVDIGDYVIKEPLSANDRKFYPCKPDIFEKTYDLIYETKKLFACNEDGVTEWCVAVDKKQAYECMIDNWGKDSMDDYEKEFLDNNINLTTNDFINDFFTEEISTNGFTLDSENGVITKTVSEWLDDVETVPSWFACENY